MNKLNKTSQSPRLSHKVIKGSSWLFLFQILDSGLGFIRLLIIARILSPADFGVVGIAWIIIQMINTFTQTGISQSLIHKQNANKYLNTAWTFLILRGIILFAMLYLAAPFLGLFFNSNASIPIIQAIGLTLLLDGLNNIGTIFFYKDLSFHKQFVLQASGSLTDFIVTIILVLITHNVWSIVFGAIAHSLIQLILSFILSSYKPKIELNISYIKELNNYGRWITWSNILQFIYSQGDDILIGRVLGPTSLGVYQLAYRISNLPTTQITYIISSVMFPAYAKIQNDREAVAKIYLLVLQFITFMSFFVGIMIICFARDFTLIFLGNKWDSIVIVMQILTIWGIIRSIGATTGPLLQAIGTPKYSTQTQILQVIIMLLIFYPFTLLWNINGTAISVVISALIPNILIFYFLRRILNISIKQALLSIIYPSIASLITTLAYFLLKHYIFGEVNIYSFTSLSILCGISYLYSTFLLNKFFGYDLFNNLITLIKSFSIIGEKNKYINKFELLLA